jgi:ferredoxin
MLQILNAVCAGKGRQDDIAELETIGKTMQDAALCALGRTAPNPVLSTIRYFRDEYDAHINEKRCPAGVCPALSRFVVMSEKCKSCGRCVKSCPAGAMKGEKKKPPQVDPALCISCGVCRNVCAYDAVAVEGKSA